MLSRCQVLILRRLDHEALDELIRRAEALEDRPLPVTPEARDALIASADGDGRFLLNQVETLFSIEHRRAARPRRARPTCSTAACRSTTRTARAITTSSPRSIRAIRGSDPQAALYYLARMLVAGEEPLYVLRRLTRAAVEDIGMADPQCAAAVPRRQGHVRLPRLARGRARRSSRPASISPPRPNRTPPTWRRRSAWRSAKETGSLMPPMHILNAPTKLMKNVGYGKGYAYDHDADEGFSGQDYWPEEMEPQTFYEPTDRGFEARVRERLEYWERAAQRAATKRRRRGLSARQANREQPACIRSTRAPTGRPS